MADSWRAGLLILGLSFYSGRLAERITTAKRAKIYLDTRGRFSSEPHLTDAQTSDEVGELSRDVQQVLRDLARYTAFWRGYRGPCVTN